jgi:hypothetical protein
MAVARAFATSLVLVAVAGCSPYVYKQEIDDFATGVKDLAATYNDGRTWVSGRDTAQTDDTWTKARARLTISACDFPDTGSPGDVECALHKIGEPVPGPTKLGADVRDGARIVKALSDYSSALAAVANAADREALTAAQAKLKTAVQGFAKEAAGGTVAGVGPAVDLFSSLTTALLDQQRYDILRSGVAAAKEPVRDLGGTLAVALGGVWMERASALRKTASEDAENLGSGKEYPARLKKLREKVAALEALRAKNPGLAAADMVVAHDALAKALIDDSRQAEAVATAVTNFLAQAAAAREAFEK